MKGYLPRKNKRFGCSMF